ncbi:MAG: hypothetical protein GY918_12590, partial [Gammaproteobacteria bacterium]|nr:hypothetical protein [Gammaproteobacteria bacterium]
EALAWAFNSGSEAFNYLAVGESLVLTYTVTATDDNSETDTQNIVITITGTNDDPVLTIDSAGSVTEEAAATLTDTGTLSFTDVDTNDTHTIGTSYNSDASWSGGTLSAAQITALTSGTFSANTSGWTYSVANSATNFVNYGETVTFSYDVTVDDGNGGTDTEAVTITINGRDDVDFSINSTASITENTQTATFDITLTGQVSAGNTASVDITPSGSAVSGTDYDNFISAITSAASSTTGVTFDGTDTLTFDENFVGTTFSFSVNSIDDVFAETSETITATLSSSTSPNGETTISIASTDTTITDDTDATNVTLSGPATIAEGQSVTITANVTTAPSGGTLVLALSNGQSITIADGATSGTVSFIAQSEDVFTDAANATYSVNTATNNGTAYENLITTDTHTVAVTDTTDDTTVTL